MPYHYAGQTVTGWSCGRVAFRCVRLWARRTQPLPAADAKQATRSGVRRIIALLLLSANYQAAAALQQMQAAL